MSMQRVFTSTRRSMHAASKDIDWSRPFWSSTPENVAKYNAFRNWVATSDAFFNKYKSPPAAIDFASAKKQARDQDLVAGLETFYKANKAPATVYEIPESDKQESSEDIEYLQQVEALSKEAVPVLQEEIKFITENRTTAETTLLDMQMAYPLLHEEVEDELERREWFKDTEFDKSRGATA